MKYLHLLASLAVLSLAAHDTMATAPSLEKATYLAKACGDSTTHRRIVSRKDHSEECVDTDRVIEFRPNWARVVSYENQVFAFQLQCSNPATSLTAFNGGGGSRSVLVSAGAPIETPIVLQDLTPDTCGLFPQPSVREAVLACRTVVTGWKGDVSACAKFCTGPQDAVCADLRAMSAFPRPRRP